MAYIRGLYTTGAAKRKNVRWACCPSLKLELKLIFNRGSEYPVNKKPNEFHSYNFLFNLEIEGATNVSLKQKNCKIKTNKFIRNWSIWKFLRYRYAYEMEWSGLGGRGGGAGLESGLLEHRGQCRERWRKVMTIVVEYESSILIPHPLSTTCMLHTLFRTRSLL